MYSAPPIFPPMPLRRSWMRADCRRIGPPSTLGSRERTRRIGDEWVAQQRSVILSVPSVILGERNYVINPAHPDFRRIAFAEAVPFQFDIRLFGPSAPRPA
jgi:hypothetical protein